MRHGGDHTWDLYIEYLKCPKCGKIIENQKPYKYRLGKYQKEVACDHCGHRFTATKITSPQFGPLFGEPQPSEIDWEELG